MNTFFKKHPSSNWTWQSPVGRTRNEIDYILNDRRDNIRDVQVATNLKFDIDHRMVRATVTLDFRRRFLRDLGNPRPKYKQEYIQGHYRSQTGAGTIQPGRRSSSNIQ